MPDDHDNPWATIYFHLMQAYIIKQLGIKAGKFPHVFVTVDPTPAPARLRRRVIRFGLV
jgi:hypothetical protein